MQRKLRGGMIGGGIGAFIGPVHRMAATLDNEAEFVAGAFSSDPAKSRKSGAAWFLHSSRVHGDWRTMVREEARLPAEKRLDFVSIVTPNASHFSIAKAFLEAGFNVVCDKPMTASLAEAKALRDIVRRSHRVFTLTHNYTGYPMVKQARHLVGTGVLGPIHKVVVEYPQGWLSRLLVDSGKKSSIWRLDPKKAGASCCMGDIGTHCENLVRYITGLRIDAVCADLTSFIPGNKLDDDGSVLIRYRGGARGVLLASQVSTGEENGLHIRVYGPRGGLEWRQEDPNYLVVKDPRGFTTTYSKGNPCLCAEAREAGRLPSGHPDGFIEAFANVYRATFAAIRARAAGKKIPAGDFPTCEDGVMGLSFIETVVRSAKSKEKWVRM